MRILEDGFHRIREYSYPLEDVRMRQVFGRACAINKILIVKGEMIPCRITIVLFKQNVGFTSVQLARRYASNWWKLAILRASRTSIH
jgi:hypothetical protein